MEQEYEEHTVSLMLDSGAYSAWNRGAQINLEEYINFCLSHLDTFDYFVSLDVMPGSPGDRIGSVSKAQKRLSASMGWKNYQTMLKAGVPFERLIHVFHLGEDFKWLKRLVDFGAPYIGLSPTMVRQTAQKIRWLDNCMEYVTNQEGFPIRKFHGFALTGLRTILRYPWYSVDSTSWLMAGAMGKIYVPGIGENQQWDYFSFFVVHVSDRDPLPSDHFYFLPIQVKNHVLKYLEDNFFTLEDMLKSHVKRKRINMLFFWTLQQKIPQWPKVRFVRDKNWGIL